MFRLDLHEARLRRTAGDLAARLLTSGGGDAPRLWVSGTTGSGRRTIVRHLRADPGIVAVELRDLADLDAPIHGLVQASAHMPGYEALIADRPGGADVDDDLRRRAVEVGRRLADAHQALVVVVPESWTETDASDDPVTWHRARAMLCGLLQIRDLPITIIGTMPGELGEFEAIHLQRIRLRAEDVAIDAVPEPLRDAADRLVRHMQSTGSFGTPLELRLRLGLVQLGVSPASIGDMALVALSKQLARKMPHRLAYATSRLLLARGPFPRAVAPQLTGLAGAELDLVTTCVAYGDASVRVADQTRAVLLQQFSHTGARAPHIEIEAGHAVLAAHYQHLDGHTSIDGLSTDRAVAWMEKVHHLAHGGPASEASWSAQRLFSRELMWAHARSLSRRRQYDQSAQLYIDSLATFGDHPYAHHYVAFNLDRAQGDRAKIERHYREAIHLDERNPWWNARLVTFLITHGTYDGARLAWRESCERVDPSGQQIEERSWLALHMHRWVARRWLTLGYVSEARAVLDEIPPIFIEREAPLAALSQDVEDAEESRRLGDSVYPPEVPIDQRWAAPRVLVARTVSGASLDAWWAGRVIATTAHEVTVVLANRDEAQHLRFANDEWQVIAGEAAEDAAGYIELGRYSDGSRVVRRVPSGPVMMETDDLEYVMGRIATWRD